MWAGCKQSTTALSSKATRLTCAVEGGAVGLDAVEVVAGALGAGLPLQSQARTWNGAQWTGPPTGRA